jgi:nucleotide-binding universal stress UspA family protein
MSLKDILVHLDDRRNNEMRLRLACDLARRHGAHLTGLFVIEPPSFAGFAMPGGAAGAEIEAWQAIQAKQREARLAVGRKLEATFGEALRAAGIAGEWRISDGDTGDLVTLQARYADLVVIGQSGPDDQGRGAAVPQSVLIGSGRPVLIVPYVGSFETLGRRVMVAWNATREAARALNDALPLLIQAEAVTVLSVNPERGIAGEGDVPAADIALHLARHGVKAEAAHVVVEDVAVGDALLSRAADLGSDLIVMGGYGHSRLREFALGGATRTLLEHMTVPTLLSH